MTVNRSRPSGIIPTLYYDDVGKALEWLVRAFGFTERFRYGPGGAPQGAQLVAGDGAIMISVARTGQSSDWDDSGKLRPPRDGEVNIIVSVHVEDADAVHDRARAFGARILHEPQTYPFGERQFTAEDFAGHRWAFSQSVEDVAPESWGAQVPLASG
jgi:uncharacterized glyoxalase superfamily protein PhnB